MALDCWDTNCLRIIYEVYFSIKYVCSNITKFQSRYFLIPLITVFLSNENQTHIFRSRPYIMGF